MKYLIILTFILGSLVSNATNYYIKNGGNDSNTGLSDSQAWATIAKIRTSMGLYAAGDSILLRKGDTFSDSYIQIGTQGASGNNIVLSSYGTGAKPIFSLNTMIPIWITAANRGYWTIDGLDIRTTYSDGYSIRGIANQYVDGTEPGAVPGWIIQNCTFNCGIYFSGPNVIIRNNTFDGTVQQSVNKSAINLRGAYGSNAIIENNTITGYTGRGVWIMRGGDDVIVRYNIIHDITSDGDNACGINNDGYGIKNLRMKVYNNHIGNIAQLGINGENAFSAEYYNNYIHDCGWYGLSIWMYLEGDNSTDHRGEITNNNYHHNIVVDCNTAMMAWDAAGYTIANNVFYKSNASGSERYAMSTVGSNISFSHHVTFVNNIVAGNQFTHIFYASANTAYPQIYTLCDYNNITPVGTEIFYDAMLGSQTLAQMQARGLMANGLITDPLFVSAGTDFSLQGTSPAINAGTTTTKQTDFIGNGLSGVQDIGAYEYVIADATNPTVTAFIIPSTSTSLTVPITTFTATDNVGVTGYLLTESSSTPSPSSGTWSGTSQTSYTFSSIGTKTLYAWAKDAAGNVSSSLTDGVIITLPPSSTKLVSHHKKTLVYHKLTLRF